MALGGSAKPASTICTEMVLARTFGRQDIASGFLAAGTFETPLPVRLTSQEMLKFSSLG